MRSLQDSIRFDYWLFGSMFLVCIMGILGIFSIVYKNPGPIPTSILIKQVFAFAIGLLVIVFYLQSNYPTLKKYASGFYITSIVLLLLVLVLGTKVRGARSWFTLGFFSFQPSELAKLAFIMFMAKFIEETPDWHGWRDLIWPFVFLMIPVGLILLQPDFGSTLVFFPVCLAMLYVGGCNSKYLLSLTTIGGLTSLLLLTRTYAELKGNVGDNFLINIATNINYALVFLLVVFAIAWAVYFFLKKMK